MKKFKITPILLFSPLSIILYYIHIRSGVWTSFSPFFIAGFVLIILLIFTFDRLIARQFNLRRIWIIEIIIIVIGTVIFLTKCIDDFGIVSN